MRLETSQSRVIPIDADLDLTNMELPKDLNKQFLKDYPNIELRTSESVAYNCHGLTFASRRCWISKNSILNVIIEDDKYIEIAMTDVKPGDIVIYFSDKGDFNHSGVVTEYKPMYASPRIFSKWG